MEIIIDYIVAALKALLALFGVAGDAEFEDNIESMFEGLLGYEPEITE